MAHRINLRVTKITDKLGECMVAVMEAGGSVINVTGSDGAYQAEIEVRDEEHEREIRELVAGHEAASEGVIQAG